MVLYLQGSGKLLCWLCTMAYKRAFAKSQKAREFKKSVADQTRSGGSGSKDKSTPVTGQSADDEAPYSPGSGYPTGTESQENTPYSPGANLGLILGGDDKDSAQGMRAVRQQTAKQALLIPIELLDKKRLVAGYEQQIFSSNLGRLLVVHII